MKNTKKILIIFLITLISLLNYSFGAELPKDVIASVPANTIVSLSSQTVNTKTEFYLVLNLSNINYTKFKVDITNTNSLTVDKVTEDVSGLSTNNVATSFIVDKNSINLEKLGVVYTSPEEETVINFSVKITNLDETKEEIKTDISDLELTIQGLEETLKSLNEILGGIEDTESDLYQSTQSSIKEATDAIGAKEQEKANLQEKLDNFSEGTSGEASIKVLNEKTETNMPNADDKENPWGDKDSMLSKEKEKEMNASMKKMMEQMTGLEKDLQNANDRISTLTQGETYKGSQNNYLKSLSITGVEFKNEFKKTTADYFARLEDDDLEKVTVNAVAEDSTAIVTIYGNTNLEDGKNKILINVTADNGAVRTYRIYLTK
ncbi:MAG: cadherin-like beta sandwich domain-containing protein [Clostridia bacterium]|nr:cadherin-like beta sandwich domain-containing protein [Clostridia bacterium]